MKKALIIGSAVADVIIHVDHLPKTQEDVHVISQKMSLGGCAYNTSDMIRHFQVPYILFSPIGAGAYGDFVRTELDKRGIHSPVPSPKQENGCCYCFVENGGERTFISYHGAEYLFQKEWFSLLDTEDIDCVYICGLEIEESTGGNIVSWLEEHPLLTVYFAPGPRINRIDPALLSRIFALHPILHLNEEEARTYVQNFQTSDDALATASNTAAVLVTASNTAAVLATASDAAAAQEAAGRMSPDSDCPLENAAAFLHRLTGNTVIVTLGERGTYYYDAEGSGCIEGVPAVQVDTIGAGDSHIGAVIACRKLGMSLRDAIQTANRAAARVVETEGALLPDEEFLKAGLPVSSQP